LAGTTAVSGATIASAPYNNVIDDFVTDANTPRPIVAGGTAATTAAGALTNLGLTATAAEINYTDGVTSPIQTQMDGKAPLPRSASGVGQWVPVSAAAGAALSLPAGGTWAYFVLLFNAGLVGGRVIGVSAGGTTIYGGAPSIVPDGLAWRIS
jgi:hypothetical protein